MRVAWCWLLLAVAAAVAEPVPVFEDARAGEAPAAWLHLGGRHARESSARALRLTDDHPFGQSGNALRLDLDADVGDWRLELPLRPVALPRDGLAAGRLTLAVRGDAAGVEVGLVDAAAPPHAVRVPLARYGAIEAGWTLFRIPLDDLLALAPDLALDRLAAVELVSARPGPTRLDVDHVWLEPGPVPAAAPVRTVLDTVMPEEAPGPPAQARFVSLASAKPTPPRVGNGSLPPAQPEAPAPPAPPEGPTPPAPPPTAPQPEGPRPGAAAPPAPQPGPPTASPEQTNSPSAGGRQPASPLPVVVTTQPPVLDGRLDDACWQTAAHVDQFVYPLERRAGTERTEAWLCVDAGYLYAAFYAHDRHPERLRAQQTVRGGSLEYDDYVALLVDPNRRGVNHYEFRVNPLGVQGEDFPESGSENYAWRGTWRAAARRVADGYQVEMAIPIRLLRFAGGQRALGVGFLRNLARAEETSYWPPMADRFEERHLAAYGPLGLAPAASRPAVLPYVIAGVDADGPRLQAGLDAKQVLANGLTGLLTLNPDFRNIADVVDTIAFSYTPRRLGETRPFFREGAGFFPNSTAFYSRRIPNLVAGVKGFGQLGHSEFGALGTLSYHGRLDSALRYTYRFTPNVSLDTSWVHRDSPDAPTNSVSATRFQAWHPLGPLSLSYGGAFFHSFTNGPGGDGNAWSVYASAGGDGRLGVDASYDLVHPEFRALDGYVPEPDIRGWSLAVNGGKRTQRHWLQNHTWDVGHSEYRLRAGPVLSTGWWADANVQFDNDTSAGLSLWAGQRPPHHDKTITGTFAWGIHSLHGGGGVVLTGGRTGGADYLYANLYQGWQPLRRLRFDVSAEYTYLYYGLPDTPTYRATQSIVTGTYTLSPTSTLSARLVESRGAVNVWVAYSLVPLNGRNLYVFFGDPNATRTRALFQVKLLWPL